MNFSNNHNVKNLKFYHCIFENSSRQRIYDEFKCNYLFDLQVKIPILAILTNFCDFHDFRKAVATAFLGISKTPMVNFEIHYFSFYLFKKFCFPATQFVPQKFEFRVHTEGLIYFYCLQAIKCYAWRSDRRNFIVDIKISYRDTRDQSRKW